MNNIPQFNLTVLCMVSMIIFQKEERGDKKRKEKKCHALYRYVFLKKNKYVKFFEKLFIFGKYN